MAWSKPPTDCQGTCNLQTNQMWSFIFHSNFSHFHTTCVILSYCLATPGVWHLQRWRVTFTEMACDVYRDGVWRLQRWHVTFTEMACDVYRDGVWRLQRWRAAIPRSRSVVTTWSARSRSSSAPCVRSSVTRASCCPVAGRPPCSVWQCQLDTVCWPHDGTSPPRPVQVGTHYPTAIRVPSVVLRRSSGQIWY